MPIQHQQRMPQEAPRRLPSLRKDAQPVPAPRPRNRAFSTPKHLESLLLTPSVRAKAHGLRRKKRKEFEGD